MKTVYIDVYFLINFCVDTLSLALALKYLKAKTSFARLIIAGVIGALYAVLGVVFSEMSFLMIPTGFVLFFLMIICVSTGFSFKRRMKLSLAFFIFQIFIGGIVYFSYVCLGRIFEKFEINNSMGGNRNILIWSLIVLLSYGVVKVLMLVFKTTESERVVKLCVGYFGRETSFDALVDTGNLATDPTSGSPVVLVNAQTATKILGEGIGKSLDPLLMSSDFQKRLRVIPIKRGDMSEILYGFTVDYVTAVKSGDYENIDVTLAIDQREDTYGGYQALLPAAAIDNVF